MRVADRETHYELGKLRAMHDRWVHHAYRFKPANITAAELAGDPEMQYHLDSIDALIEMDADEDGAA
jgi:hypothetical protein